MRLSELLREMKTLDREISGISCDSRQVQPGNLFVAIPGSSRDGSAYIQEAQEKGAAAIVTEQSLPYIRVPDARRALAELSSAFYDYPAREMTMVAVTGTNGKTSVCWLVKQVLEVCTGQRVGLIGTVENHIGDLILPAERTTPQSNDLQRMLRQMVAAGCQYCVMEVSSHAVAQQRVGGIRFDVGAFTNLSREHLDYHKTMEDYCAAKGALFSCCRRAVVNVQDPWGKEILRQCPPDSLKTGEDLRGESIVTTAAGVEFMAVYGNTRVPVSLSIPGDFMVDNALTVLGVALQLGIPLVRAAAALEGAKGVRGRMEAMPTPGMPFTVLIDYAHTPDGMEKVLTSLRKICKGRLIALFGCGGDRDRGKRPEMGKIAVTSADIAIITSDNPRSESPMSVILDILQGVGEAKNYKVFENRVTATRYAIDIGKKDDIIVLLGKGHETGQEIGGRRYDYDERQILQDILAEMR